MTHTKCGLVGVFILISARHFVAVRVSVFVAVSFCSGWVLVFVAVFMLLVAVINRYKIIFVVLKKKKVK